MNPDLDTHTTPIPTTVAELHAGDLFRIWLPSRPAATLLRATTTPRHDYRDPLGRDFYRFTAICLDTDVEPVEGTVRLEGEQKIDKLVSFEPGQRSPWHYDGSNYQLVRDVDGLVLLNWSRARQPMPSHVAREMHEAMGRVARMHNRELADPALRSKQDRQVARIETAAAQRELEELRRTHP